MSKIGKINLIIGCMFSSKSSTLINRYKRYTIGGKKCLMVKFKRDNRYDLNSVVTHDGIKIKAVSCEFLKEITDLVYNYDVICIDEVQFYSDADIICDIWANNGLVIEACGLSGDFERKPFSIVSNLISKAEDIIFMKAVCKKTGQDAVYSKLMDIPENVESKEIIGGSDKYEAVDRLTYFE